MAKEPYIKINDRHINSAELFFKNDTDFNEFCSVLIRFLMQKEIIIKRKRVQMYWDIVENHYKALLESKISGKIGGNKRAENQRDTSPTLATPLDTTLPSNKKENKKEKENKNIYREFKHLMITQEEIDRILLEGYSIEEINDELDSIENYKNNKNYTSLNLTVRKWLKKNKEQTPKPETKMSRTENNLYFAQKASEDMRILDEYNEANRTI